MTVYIKSLNGFPVFDMGMSALFGFKQNGTNIVLYEDLDEVPLNRNTLLVSSIEETKEWFRRMNWIENPEIPTIPHELSNFEYVGREIRYRDMKYVRSLQEDSFPIFVKPVNLKQFNAGVINNIHQIGWIEPNLPDDTPCITSEVIEILSEYRCYIIDGKCEGIYHYLGDIFQFPDSEFILKCIKDFKSAPKAYSLDIGITSYQMKRGKQNIVIECNDFWSLGNYGLSPKLYCRGLMIRWRELLQLNKI